jgi:hypothetical protein
MVSYGEGLKSTIKNCVRFFLLVMGYFSFSPPRGRRNFGLSGKHRFHGGK